MHQAIAEAALLACPHPKLAEHQVDCLKEGTWEGTGKREPQPEVGEPSDSP